MKINKLSEELINQIAAGEVIERPANVVKELIENALDAGATQIRIQVEQGGKKRISIQDNGFGMDLEDIKMATMRHATSKIQTAADLFRIQTLGFRGEALSSIASISKMSISSQEKNKDVGYELVFEFGKIVSEKKVIQQPGTHIEVWDLFENLPVRQKYLKTDLTELSHISDWVQKFILAYPEHRFELLHDERSLLFSPGFPDNGLKQAMAAVWGPQINKGLIPVEFKTDRVQIAGFVSNPQDTRSDRTAQMLFLNGRWIYNAALHKAVQTAYQNLIPGNRFPVWVLKLNCHPAWVDVNVHPTKKEVRFQDPAEIFSLLKAAVQKSILVKNFDLIQKIENRALGFQHFPVASSPKPKEFLFPHFLSPERVQAPPTFWEAHKILELAPQASKPEFEILTQLYQTYILLLKDEKFWIVDQHVAEERYLFEKLLKQKATHAAQGLLIPVGLQIPPSLMLLLEENLYFLQEMGFQIEKQDSHQIRILAMPDLLMKRIYGKQIAADQLLLQTLEQIKKEESQPGQKEEDLRHQLLKTLACKASIKAGDTLNFEQMQTVIASWLTCENLWTCPHGRPIVWVVEPEELHKRFKRI